MAIIKMTDATGKKGPNMTLLEDIELAKAFVATSEDSIVGSNQKSTDFKAKMLSNHNVLIAKHNKNYTKQHVQRNNKNSLCARFKHLSRLTLKMLGIEETMGEPPSGDNDREKFNEMIKQTWIKRNPDDSRHCDVVWMYRVILRKHPKWRKFQSDEDAVDEQKRRKREAKQARPLGAKKAKSAAADKQLIQNLVTTVSEDAKTVNSAGMEKVSGSIEVVTKGKASEQAGSFSASGSVHLLTCRSSAFVESIQAQNAHLMSQNDLRLMESLSPTSKKTMAKNMAQLRMAEMQKQIQKLSNEKPKNIQISRTDANSMVTSADGDDNSIDVEVLATAGNNDYTMPDGQRMCLTVEECERRCGHHEEAEAPTVQEGEVDMSSEH